MGTGCGRRRRDAGAHLYLANALVEKGDFDAAATHYRKSLGETDEHQELMEFLLRRPRPVQAAIRSGAGWTNSSRTVSAIPTAA